MQAFALVVISIFLSVSGCRTLSEDASAVRADGEAPGASDTSLKNWDLIAAKASFAIYLGSKPTDSLIPTRDALKDVFGSRFAKDRIHIRNVGDLRYAVLENDREMAIVVRGTENTQELIGATANWLRNLDFTLIKLRVDDGVNCPFLRICSMRVHKGFWNAAGAIVNDAGRLISDNKDKQIYVIGHSLGGSIAQLLMMRIYDDMTPKLYPYVFTYGAPKVANNWGNQGIYRRAYIRKWFIAEDPVPRLPVGILNNTGIIHSFFGTNDLNATTGKRWVNGRDLPIPSISSHEKYVQRISDLQAIQDTDTGNGGKGFNTLRLAEDQVVSALTSTGLDPLPARMSNDFVLSQTNDPQIEETFSGQKDCVTEVDDITNSLYCFETQNED